jgi:hypothetical protein
MGGSFTASDGLIRVRVSLCAISIPCAVVQSVTAGLLSLYLHYITLCR